MPACRGEDDVTIEETAGLLEADEAEADELAGFGGRAADNDAPERRQEPVVALSSCVVVCCWELLGLCCWLPKPATFSKTRFLIVPVPVG
jgi:hypothetical protein